jgi:ribosomal protein S18 acetylase RimI-like enzyme
MSIEKFKRELQDRDDTKEYAEIKTRIKEFNTAKVGEPKKTPLNIFIRDESNALVAGLLGYTIWNWLSIDFLWVAESLRGQRVGESLVQQAESEALIRGCKLAQVDTFSFQAPGFYKKMGYQIFGELEHFPTEEHSRHYLFKRLSVK